MTTAALFAFWLLLVDTHEEAQILVGVGVAMLAGSISELVRRQRIAQVQVRPRWLARLWRPVSSVPRDLLRLAVAVLPGQRPTSRIRALPFDPGVADPTDHGRQALAELTGSFSPNTIVIGIDAERGLLLAHQLVPQEEEPERSLDRLELASRKTP
ncbi:MAG TPA: Na+/H+ antiporter subunit E [Solirubrobacterales bacterium]|nr:Na+/H+ antiporter subunit E [Solirubrobacterales bacterium]